MSRNFNFAEGEFYHVYNRGTDKRIVFSNTHDYRRFVLLLYLCNGSISVDVSESLRGGMEFRDLIFMDRGETLVDIGAYCLMPNHFHILIREKHEGGISLFMKKLSNAYTMYFNKRHERTGGLFEGRFKAQHVGEDRYLKYLFAYIHLNPVKLIEPWWVEDGIKNPVRVNQYLDDYKYSSYPEYMGRRRSEGRILQIQNYPKYFHTSKEFESFVNDWLNFKGQAF